MSVDVKVYACFDIFHGQLVVAADTLLIRILFPKSRVIRIDIVHQMRRTDYEVKRVSMHQCIATFCQIRFQTDLYTTAQLKLRI